MNVTSAPTARHRRLVALGVLAAGTSVACAGGAMAVAPGSTVSRALSGVLQSVGIGWEGMPEGYTAEQYAALWEDGYTGGAQRRSGLPVDGRTVRVTPGTSTGAGGDATSAALDAFWSAGYTYQDAVGLAALWNTDELETKTRAGRTLLEGQQLPVAPGATVAAGS